MKLSVIITSAVYLALQTSQAISCAPVESSSLDKPTSLESKTPTFIKPLIRESPVQSHDFRSIVAHQSLEVVDYSKSKIVGRNQVAPILGSQMEPAGKSATKLEKASPSRNTQGLKSTFYLLRALSSASPAGSP